MWFFENVGGFYVCVFVIDWFMWFYCECKVQFYVFYDVSCLGGEEMDEVWSCLVVWMGVEIEEVIFGLFMIQNIYVLF